MERTLERLRSLALVAVVRGASPEAAVEVVDALVEGGIVGIEITFTTPDAPGVMADLAERYGDRILLGAGTVTTTDQVEQSAESGASFLVSPGCDQALVPRMRDTGLAVLPGVLTPSEVMLALRLGIRTVKLFPGSFGGPGYLKGLRGPFPDVGFVPTGGVSVDNLASWFAAGAFAVGVGSALSPARLKSRSHRDDVVATARKFTEAVVAQRG